MWLAEAAAGCCSSVSVCLASRLSRGVGGVPRVRGSPFRVVGMVPAGQPGARACRRLRDHDRGIDVDRDQPPVRAGRPVRGQRPGPLVGRGTGFADGPQRPGRVRAQGVDQPWAGSRCRNISQAVPAQRQRYRQISNDLPGSCTAFAAHHRPRPAGRSWPSPVTRTASRSSNAPAWDTSPRPSADTVILGRRAATPWRNQPERGTIAGFLLSGGFHFPLVLRLVDP